MIRYQADQLRLRALLAQVLVVKMDQGVYVYFVSVRNLYDYEACNIYHYPCVGKNVLLGLHTDFCERSACAYAATCGGPQHLRLQNRRNVPTAFLFLFLIS